MLKTDWKYCAIAAAFNFVGRQNSSSMGDTSPVPLNLLPSAVTPSLVSSQSRMSHL